MYVEANGCVFECRIDGDSGPSVTLSHGLATDMSRWDELADALRERFRVLRYDARGYGKSQAPPRLHARSAGRGRRRHFRPAEH